MVEYGSRHEPLAREIARLLGGSVSTGGSTGGGTATVVAIHDQNTGATLVVNDDGSIAIANQFVLESTFTSSVGQSSNAAAGNDTGNFSLISLTKRLLVRFTFLLNTLSTIIADAQASSTSTVTSVDSSTSSAQILAVNAARKPGSSIYNNSTSNLYLRLGLAPASAASFTVIVAAGGYYELPRDWRGGVQGVWTAANGAALTTELSA